MIGKKRREYLNQFHRTASGEYVYSGEHYTFQSQGKSRRRAMTELWLSCTVAVAAVVAGGCIPAPGVGNCAYVLIPYVAAVIAAVSGIWSLGQLTAGGDPLRAYVYDDTVKKLPLRLILTAVFAGVSCLGEGLFLLLNGGQGKTGFAVLFLVLEAAATLAAVLGRWAFSRLTWSK